MIKDKELFTRKDRQGIPPTGKAVTAILVARYAKSTSSVTRDVPIEFQIEERLYDLMTSGSRIIPTFAMDIRLGPNWHKFKVSSNNENLPLEQPTPKVQGTLLQELEQAAPQTVEQVLNDIILSKGLTQADTDDVKTKFLKFLEKRKRAKRKQERFTDIPYQESKWAFLRRVMKNNFRPKNNGPDDELVYDYYKEHAELSMVCEYVDANWQAASPSRSRVYLAYWKIWQTSPQTANAWLHSLNNSKAKRAQLRRSDERRHREAHEELMQL